MKLTCEEYKSLGLTCEEYESLGLTCGEYDSMTFEKLKDLVTIRLNLFNSIKGDTPLPDEAITLVKELANQYPDVAKTTLQDENPSSKNKIDYFIQFCIKLATNPEALIFWARKIKQLIDYLL